MRNHIRIGTRKSALALWQSEYVKSELQRLYPAVTVELVHFNTKGDRILNKPLAEVGGKGLFTAELEAAMHAGRYRYCRSQPKRYAYRIARRGLH